MADLKFGVLYSRVRVEEKWLFEAFDKRGVAYDRIDDRTLNFVANGDGTYTDAETGSIWNILGEAVAGDLAGQRLTQILAFDHFWFAWAAFHPETALYSTP